MRRSGIALVLILSLLVMACRLPVGPLGGRPSPAANALRTSTPVPPTATATETETPQPTFTPTPVRVLTQTPTASPSPEPAPDPHLSPEDILILPSPPYQGDRISIDVEPALVGMVSQDQLAETFVSLSFDGTGPFTATVSPQGFDGMAQARFYWVGELPEGEASVRLTLTLLLPEEVSDPDPANNTVVLPLELPPRAALPPPELGAQWAVTETEGVRLHYLTGSAAERDLDLLLGESRQAYRAVTTRLGEPDEPVDIYLLDRVVGQGGYASSEWVAVTYTDRRYSPVVLGSVLRHELTHRLDSATGCDGTPPLVREGLAVYLAGGHYRSEPLREKARALLTTRHYVPLDRLVSDFYTQQHEVGYLEGAAVVAYVVDTFGWQAMTEACQATAGAEGGDEARWEAFVLSLGVESPAVLEERWWTWLNAAPGEGDGAGYDPDLLELEFRLMEAMRAYQARYDTTAHFIEGILFDPAGAEERGIVADFVRRPRDPVSIGFELVLSMGQEAVEQRDTEMLALLVEDLELALAQGVDRSVFVQDAVEITALALEQDYEPSRLLLTLGIYGAVDGVGASTSIARRYLVDVVDLQAWPQQAILTAERVGGVWQIQGVSASP